MIEEKEDDSVYEKIACIIMIFLALFALACLFAITLNMINFGLGSILIFGSFVIIFKLVNTLDK